MMEFDEYQKLAASLSFFDRPWGPGVYSSLGLAGESGEVCDKIKKLYRDHGGVVTDEFREGLKKELGDTLWYLSKIAEEFGIPLSDVAAGNIDKIMERREKGTLHGNGDNR